MSRAKANDGSQADHIAHISSGAVSNARFEVLSVNPLRFQDTETGREYGLEDASVVEVSGNAVFAKFDGGSREEHP